MAGTWLLAQATGIGSSTGSTILGVLVVIVIIGYFVTRSLENKAKGGAIAVVLIRQAVDGR